MKQQPRARSATRQSGSAGLIRLHHRPGTIAVLDDHPEFVSALTGMLERSHLRVRPFTNVHDCRERLMNETASWRADHRTQIDLVNEWQQGRPVTARILDYLVSSSAQQAERAKVLIIGDAMPGMDGLQLLSELSDWPGHRLLLRSSAFDEEEIAHALGRGLFDQCIEKSDTRFLPLLRKAVPHLHAQEDEQSRKLWAATLTPRQSALLTRQDVAHDLAPLLEDFFAEWIVIGRPFGVIGLDHTSRPRWQPLATTDSLTGLAGAAKEAGVPPDQVMEIASGRKLADADVRLELGNTDINVVEAREAGAGGDLIVAAAPMELPQRMDGSDRCRD